MIELYATNDSYRRGSDGKPPWQDFAGKLHMSLSEARRIEASDRRADAWTCGGNHASDY
jgi:hypothetical protein